MWMRRAVCPCVSQQSGFWTKSFPNKNRVRIWATFPIGNVAFSFPIFYSCSVKNMVSEKSTHPFPRVVLRYIPASKRHHPVVFLHRYIKNVIALRICPNKKCLPKLASTFVFSYFVGRLQDLKGKLSKGPKGGRQSIFPSQFLRPHPCKGTLRAVRL